MLATAESGLAEALLLLSYPLHPPQRLDVMRTRHFPELRTPALFVHGTCDDFGSINEMEAAIRMIPAQTELLPVPGAGHELLMGKNRAGLPGLVVNTFLEFVAKAGT